MPDRNPTTGYIHIKEVEAFCRTRSAYNEIIAYLTFNTVQYKVDNVIKLGGGGGCEFL